MTPADATKIGSAWLARQPWGDAFQVTTVRLESNLAIVFWTAKNGERIAGNAPLLIDAKTGAVHSTGTAKPIRHYIENLHVTGDPHLEPAALKQRLV